MNVEMNKEIFSEKLCSFLFENYGVLLKDASKIQFEEMQDMISKLTIKDVIWQLFNNNIFNSLTLPPIIAFFVRKTS